MKKLIAALALAAAALACAPAGAAAATGSSVSTTPASWTPSIADVSTDGTTEEIRQLTPCGGTMYAAGIFSSIKSGASVVTRHNAFSFSMTTGALTAFDPNLNGIVNSVAVSSDCATVYLGGKFTLAGTTAVRNLVAVSASTGAVIPTFAHSAGGQVNALLVVGGHLLVGAYAGKVNASAGQYLVSVNPSTGRDDGYANLAISGNYQFSGVDANPTRVYSFALGAAGSAAANKLLVTGDFTSVGGQHREQIVMLDLGATATVDAWTSTEFLTNCNHNEAFWLQAAAWSPDGSTVYTAATGYKPNGSSATAPRSGLCDSAAAFPSTSASVTHTWIQYTGCDSLFAVAADSATVYVGGHERYLDNPNGCDTYLPPGATRVNDQGMGGLDPATGNALLSAPSTGLYYRSRGTGADDEIVVAPGLPGAGLWVASDNGTTGAGSTTCMGVGGKAGICYLPY